MFSDLIKRLTGGKTRRATTQDNYGGSLYYDPNKGVQQYNGNGTWGNPTNAPAANIELQPATDWMKEQSNTSNTSNYRYNGGGGVQSDPEAEQRNTLKSQIQEKFKTFQSVFDSLFGNIDKSFQEKANQVSQAYDKQNSDLTDQFGNTLGQVNNIYAARGLTDSSYIGDKVGQVSKDYYSGLADIGQNRQNSMGELGQKLASTKAGLQAQRNAYNDAMNNLDQYSASDLASLQSTLGQAYDNANLTSQNFLTTPDYVNKLASISPVANAGTSALANQLQTLVTSSAPIFAKKEIAKGLIKRSQLTDKNAQNYWSNYFEDLLSKNGVA